MMSRRFLSLINRPWTCNFYKKINSYYKTCSTWSTGFQLSRISSISSRRFSQVVDYYSRFEDAASFDLEFDSDTDSNVRTAVQYDKSDPVINNLLKCSTVQDVFNVIEENRSNFQKEHAVQSILMLWYLQNVFVKVQTQLDCITDVTEDEYVAELQKHPTFNYLLENVESLAKNMDFDELSCSLLYLTKMNIDLRSDAMEALLNQIEQSAESDPSSATLTTLSRSAVALKYDTHLRSNFFLLGILPIIETKLDTVTDPNDLRLVTICLMHTHLLTSQQVLEKYKRLCEKFVSENILTHEHDKAIVKMLTFLSLTFWANQNTEIVRNLGRILQGHVKNLDTKELVSLSKALQTHQEPAGLLEEVSQEAKTYLSSGNQIPDKNINVGMLMAATQRSSYSDKRKLEKLLYKELEGDYFLSNMISLFHVLRIIKSSDHKLCHLFWWKTSEALKRHAVERESNKLLRVAHRYMYFNNNMGGTYRHYRFEKQMITWILDEIEFGSTGYMPSKLTKGVSFVIAYCQDTHVLTQVINRLLIMGHQLSQVDCVVLSRGIEIMLGLNRRKQIHSEVMQKLVELDTCLNECTWRHLEEPNLSLPSIIALLRTFHNRRASPDSLLFYTIMKRLEETNNDLNSRMIKDLSFCLSGLGYLIPKLMDLSAEYVATHEDDILAETAERVLSTVFYLGYTPTAGDRFFQACARLLMRDMNRLSSLSVVQACLALSYFHSFPAELVNTVFAVDFLERIDEELATCYSKATYPVKVRYSLMELNRSVCLDQPQLDVPWFHAKYCQEISALDPRFSSGFHEEVAQQLEAVLGNGKFLQTEVYSPYGYKINFLVLLDAMTKPLTKECEAQAKDRIAILLHSDSQFTVGERRLKGPQQMRQRHLEMMGFRVFPISEFVWNAMYLTESNAKKTFLADHIWPDR